MTNIFSIKAAKKKILLDSKRDIKNFSAYFSIDKTLDELQSQIPSSGTMADIFSSGYKEFISITNWTTKSASTIKPKILTLSLTPALLTIVMLSIYFLLYHQWNTANW
jgi:hypothetical protein